jgi:hypothetical protein
MKKISFRILLFLILIVQVKCKSPKVNESKAYGEMSPEERLEHYSVFIYPQFISSLKKTNEKDEYKLEYMCMMYCGSIYQEKKAKNTCLERCAKDLKINLRPSQEIFKKLFKNKSKQKSLKYKESNFI